MADRSTPGHIGTAADATATKGEALFEIFTDGVSQFLQRVAAWDGQGWDVLLASIRTAVRHPVLTVCSVIRTIWAFALFGHRKNRRFRRKTFNHGRVQHADIR